MKNLTYNRVSLYTKQKDAFFNDARYSICEASTKAGKTYGALAWLLEIAMLHGRDGRNYWWVAPVYVQAQIAYRRAKKGIPRMFRSTNDSEMRITLINGVIILFKSGERPDSLYGEDVYAAVIDEASRLREEAWIATRSTLTKTRGKIRIIGNVKGRGNWFYKMARKAEQGHDNFFYSKITAYDAVEAGVLDKSEIEDAKQNLSDRTFKELYLAEAADDGGNPFGLNYIDACVQPMSKKPSVVYGVDLAKYYDYTVIVGLDKNCNVSYFNRFQKSWEIQSQIIENACKAPTLVDSSGVGDPIVESLRRRKPSIFTGYKFTSGSKQDLMELLEYSIQRKAVRFPDNEIRKELDVFEYRVSRTNITYNAPSGLHDDCVIALALALKKYTDTYKYINYEPLFAWV